MGPSKKNFHSTYFQHHKMSVFTIFTESYFWNYMKFDFVEIFPIQSTNIVVQKPKVSFELLAYIKRYDIAKNQKIIDFYAPQEFKRMR